MPDAFVVTEGEKNLAKVYGEGTRCPHCGAFAQTLPHPEHRWVCAVCGAPRVVMPEGTPLPEEAAVALREATTAQRSAAIQRLSSWAMGLPAGASLLLAIALAPASFLAAGVLVGAGVLLAVLATRSSRRAATERKRLRSAVERAYEAAIAALTLKDKTPTEVAAALRIAESDVETALAVQGHMRIAEPVRIASTVTESVAAPETETETETESVAATGTAKK